MPQLAEHSRSHVIFIAIMIALCTYGSALARTLIEVEHTAKGGCKIVNHENALLPESERNFDSLAWTGKCKSRYADGPGTIVAKRKGVEITAVASFIRGRLEGQGTYEAVKENGDREFFKGKFANGLRSGEGYQTIIKVGQDTVTYTGNFVAGLPHGNGKLEKGGTIYAGEFVEGRPTGIGTITYPTKVVYSGEVRDGKANGSGKLTLLDGTTIAGTFSPNRPLTIGHVVSPKGYRYEGELEKFQPSGRGKLTSPTGSVFTGDFKNGKPNGLGVVETSAGQRIEVTATDGKITPRDSNVVQKQEASSEEEEGPSWLQILGAVAEGMNAAQERSQRHGFLKGERSSGFNKICVYDTIRGEVAINRGVTDICPLTID